MQASMPNGLGTDSVPAFETIRTVVVPPRGSAVQLLGHQ